MRICSLCMTSASNAVQVGANYGADIARQSAAATVMSRLRGNTRISRIRLIVYEDTCPACEANEGDFDMMSVPDLPGLGCSHSLDNASTNLN